MFPIVKIRLTYIKRNLIKSIFSFGYPIIIIYLFTIILKNSDKLELFPEALEENQSKTPININNKKIQSNGVQRHSPTYFDLFNTEEIKLITNGDVGIISDNEDLLSKFKSFALDNFCTNLDEMDLLNTMMEEMMKSLNVSKKDKDKIPYLNSLNCKVKTFKSKEEFDKYLYSIEYKNESEFKVVFEFTQKNDILNINILSKEININSVEKSKNLLLLDNSGGQNEIISSVLNPTNTDVSYQNYYSIISNFLKEYNNYNKQKITIKDEEKINIYYKPLNTPNIYNKLSNELTLTFIPMVLSISFSSTLFSFVLWMVKEKSQNLHEFLFRYGITPNKYYRSWFITFIILTIFPIIICSYLIVKYAFVNINIFLIFFFVNDFRYIFI